MPLDAFVVQIDYTCQPETYNVVPLASYHLRSERQEALLLDRVRRDPRRYTVIEVMIPRGEYPEVLLTVRFNLWAPPSDTLSGELYDEGGLSAEVD